jgi:protein TonB
MRLLSFALTATLIVAATLPAQQSVPRIQVEAPPPQTAAPGPPQRSDHAVRISGGVMAGQRLSGAYPVYPADARASGIEGAVVLHVLVGADGRVESAVPLSGPEVFRQPAMDAVTQWIYRPYLLNGQPVEVDTIVTVNFNLTRGLPPQF